MRIVVALGGNALLRRGERPEAETQRARVHEAARAIAAATHGHDLVVVHGNGPQVGMLALESTADRAIRAPYPLADLTAETQGLIGHWIAAGFRAAEPSRTAVALVTHVVVDPDDPALGAPSKPIGPVLTSEEAERQRRERHWTFRPDGEGMRRVVGSPPPLRVVEAPAADVLLHAGAVVVIGGGGGVAVTESGDEVDVVVDKDLVAAEIAIRLRADRLVILTDVPTVVDGFGTRHAHAIRGPIASGQLRAMSFAPGSMGPKVEAVCRFADATGGVASIGDLDDVAGVIDGTVGTHILPSLAAEAAG